ncbi:MAG: IS21 family transposase [Wenzhouxiangella sp.]
MTIKTLARKGTPKRSIARQLDMTEGNVRYHLRRIHSGAVDGRSRQRHKAADWAGPIDFWLSDRRLRQAAVNLADLHEWLVGEHDYSGSLRSVQRYVAAHYPPPRQRARRRVETPPGAQGQVDWGTWPNMLIAGQRVDLQGFHLALSHSRRPAVIWSFSQDQLSWLWCHNRAFERIGGIPAVLRVDNTKTAVGHGAGPWGQINATYRRYATTLRFHVDACLPFSPAHKGKVERLVRTGRSGLDITRRAWDSLEELQIFTDERIDQAIRRRRCPATGLSVHESWQAERKHLAPVPLLPEPFDMAVTRTVSADCLVSFEGRQYSVPFQWVGQAVEVRGCCHTVQILAGAGVITEHPRQTRTRLVLDPDHYEGPSTDRVIAPMPLGKMGRKLAELAAIPVEHRPLDLYAELAEVAR